MYRTVQRVVPAGTELIAVAVPVGTLIRMTEDGARERLLENVIAYVSEHGIGDVSLRTLAAELGTSHRMLIYHFGSKDGLLRAIVETIEGQQRAVLAELLEDPDITV